MKRTAPSQALAHVMEIRAHPQSLAEEELLTAHFDPQAAANCPTRLACHGYRRMPALLRGRQLERSMPMPRTTNRQTKQPVRVGNIVRKLVGRLFLCPRGKHKRSKRHVREDGQDFISRCAYCGAPMVRLQKHQWIIDERRQ